MANATSNEVITLNTSVEREIATIWRHVLGIDGAISATANFFALGGHSLSATQIVSRVNKAFGIHLPLCDFLSEPTVGRLALMVEERHLMIDMVVDVETSTAMNTSLERDEFTL